MCWFVIPYQIFNQYLRHTLIGIWHFDLVVLLTCFVASDITFISNFDTIIWTSPCLSPLFDLIFLTLERSGGRCLNHSIILYFQLPHHTQSSQFSFYPKEPCLHYSHPPVICWVCAGHVTSFWTHWGCKSDRMPLKVWGLQHHAC